MEEIDLNNVPRHVAIIMDGNGRWAQRHHLDRSHGHVEGVKRVEEIVDVASKWGIKAITLYTFSTENWSRPETEINILMNLLMTVINSKIKKLKDDNIRFQTIGRPERVPESVAKAIDKLKEETKNNTGLIVNLAFNYGSRLEIVDAVKEIAQAVLEKRLRVEQITEQAISSYLYTKHLMDPDLLIRTSGEKRISNFLLWQLSYAEFYFTEVCWPDFNETEFKKAIIEYQKRERRFGSVNAGKG